MSIRTIVAGATGWAGSAVLRGLIRDDTFILVGAVALEAEGQDVGEVLGLKAVGVSISATLEAALATPCDVLIDYTHPSVVKGHVLAAIERGIAVVVGTSGLSAADYDEIDRAARTRSVGVFAAGNYSITATLMTKFALTAARYVADVEVIDYASATKPDTPSGTARELAERLSTVRLSSTARPIEELSGVRETRGGTVGAVQVHSLRLPSYTLSCEAVFGAADERLVIRHDAGPSAAPYVAGTLLAARHVRDEPGLRRGLDQLLS